VSAANRTSEREHRSRLVVIDAANTLYRAFFALPPLRNSAGQPTNSVYGFVNMLQKVIREESPDHLVVVFDAPGGTFRQRLFPAYKATREAQPEDLSAQFPLAREVVDAYGIPILQIPGVEADDVIATLVALAPSEFDVTIVSTDKDLMQLVTERVTLLDTMKDRRFGPAEVEERFGVPPGSLLDVRALVGDASDNIPGVKGIGEKGAAQLIREWGSLENLLAHAGEVGAKRAREALLAQADDARLSKRLATLEAAVALPIGIQDLARREPDRARLRALFERLEFTRLLQSLDAPAASDAGASPAPKRAEATGTGGSETRIVEDAPGLARLLRELAECKGVTLLAVTSGEGALRENLLGLAFAHGQEQASYVPLQSAAFDAVDVLEGVAALFVGAAGRPWATQASKRVQSLFAERGLELPPPAFDHELAAYLLDPSASRGVEALATQLLGCTLRSWEDLVGRGAKAIEPALLPTRAMADWAGEQVRCLAGLEPLLAERISRDGLSPLLHEVELPLTAVLGRMERTGVRIAEAVLAELSRVYERELERIAGEIYGLAGETFQISSPKQLQRILFEKLKLPSAKRTKTGFSTDEAVLEQLAPRHELPAKILAHRRLAKLKSTYVDALPPLINPATGRVHPTFVQTGAATGRLSCTNPNVQNIPIRSPEGIRIREAFVPAEGCQLLSADYSQVELRILAHYSGDASLIDAFRRGEDIHRRTWAEVAGKAPADVTSEERARAKAVNFGIIYGSSAFGLANQLGIPGAEAQATIDAYFARYQGVRRFLDETIATASKEGFVRTLLGRRRYLPDLRSRNRTLRNAAERMAVNTVIQGTAADLIKKAMVELDAWIREARLRTCMILQVHDELVFEVPEGELEKVRAEVPPRMEQVLSLTVPLLVDVGVGGSWREAH
jgi:DNA polymerase-1